MRRLPILIALLACASAVQAQSTKSSHDAAFDAVYAKFTEAYKRADPAMVTQLYSADAFYLAPGRMIVRGQDSVLSAFSFLKSFKDRPTGPAIGFRIVDRQVSGDIAWDIGYYLMNSSGAAITEQDHPGGKFIVLWKRGADGQWRIFADGYSDVPRPPAESAEAAAAEQAVRHAVQAYFDGIMNYDVARLDLAFHPEAQLSAALPDGRVYRSSYQEWKKFTSHPKPDTTGKNNRIVNVQMMGNAAVVTTLLDWPSIRYVDYLSLIKTGADEWKIVSKIWHQQPKQN
jgi:ketosteroid isomerase-like protein